MIESRSENLQQILSKSLTFRNRNDLRWFNYWNPDVIEIQTVQRWLGICWNLHFLEDLRPEYEVQFTHISKWHAKIKDDLEISKLTISHIFLQGSWNENCDRKKFVRDLCSENTKNFMPQLLRSCLKLLTSCLQTGDESCVYDSGPETKVHSSRWKMPGFLPEETPKLC